MFGSVSRRLLVGATAVGLLLSAACSSGSSGGESQSGTTTAQATSATSATSAGSTPAESSASGQSSAAAGSSAGAGSGSAVPAEIVVPDSIKAKGAIDIATFFNYPPYTVVNGGKLEGIEPGLVRAIAAKMGVEARFHDLAFEAMIPSVINGRNDMMIGSLADTAARRESVSFVDLWKQSVVAVVRKGNPTNVDPNEPCGRTVVQSSASYQMTVLKEQDAACTKAGKSAIKIVTVDDSNGENLGVVNGRAEYTLMDPAVAKSVTSQLTTLEVLPNQIALASDQLSGWIFRKDDAALRNAVIASINQLVADGTWQKLLKDAGLDGSALIPPMVDSEPVK